MCHLIHFVEIYALVTTNQQHAKQVVDVADVVDVQRVNNLDAVYNHVIRV